ncbi:MAG: response regulator [Alphaproteobacteria bacterium]|nr:response regulator [Alphaproteobacteria bacterium]
MAAILVVDDEPLVRTTVKTVLGRDGHTIVFCENGRQALKAFAERPFDAVLSDVRMPQGDGVWLLCEIRKVAAELPVFLMTGLTDDPRLEGVVFDAHTKLLKKPLDLRGLRAMLAQIGEGAGKRGSDTAFPED